MRKMLVATQLNVSNGQAIEQKQIILNNKIRRMQRNTEKHNLTITALKLRCDERFTHAFSKKLRWLAQTKVISLKMQLHAVNAR